MIRWVKFSKQTRDNKNANETPLRHSLGKDGYVRLVRGVAWREEEGRCCQTTARKRAVKSVLSRCRCRRRTGNLLEVKKI